jgi:hypothetical protein
VSFFRIIPPGVFQKHPATPAVSSSYGLDVIRWGIVSEKLPPSWGNDSEAMTLVQAGVPSVLGWDGSVYDTEATAFARELYRAIVLRRPLEDAVATARRTLLTTARKGQASRDCAAKFTKIPSGMSSRVIFAPAWVS